MHKWWHRWNSWKPFVVVRSDGGTVMRSRVCINCGIRQRTNFVAQAY